MCHPKTLKLSHCHPKLKTTSRWVISLLKLSVWNDPDVYHTHWVHWVFGSNPHFNKLTLGWWRLIHRESGGIRRAWWVFGVCMNCGQSQTAAAQTYNAKQRNDCTAVVNVSVSVSEVAAEGNSSLLLFTENTVGNKTCAQRCDEYSNLYSSREQPEKERGQILFLHCHLFCARQDHFTIICIKLVTAFFFPLLDGLHIILARAASSKLLVLFILYIISNGLHYPTIVKKHTKDLPEPMETSCFLSFVSLMIPNTNKCWDTM